MTVPDLTLDAGLPANVDAEKTILGAILLDNKAHIEAAEVLKADDFSLDGHRRIFLRMTELMDSNRAVDIVTLAAELGRHKEVEAVGGVTYLASLTEGLPRRPVIHEYIRIVKDKSLLRRLMLICSATIARAADQSEEAIGIGIQLGSQIESVVSDSVPPTFRSAGEYFAAEFPTPEAMMEKTAKDRGIETGFSALDKMTCGLQNGDLIILAARPSMGKTALAVNIADHVAVNCEGTVLFNSLEMTEEALLRRAICSRARVSFQKHRNREMLGNRNLVDYFSIAYQEISRAKMLIDASPKSAVRIATQWRALKHRQPFDLGIIDFLTLLQHDDMNVRYRSEAQLIGNDCYILKMLAKELSIPIVVLCQLNREVTKRTDKRPTLADLRECGRIEEYADLVAFIHREGYYDPKDESLKNKAEVIISKQRQGPTGTIDLTWEGEYLRFSDPVTPEDLQTQDYLNW